MQENHPDATFPTKSPDICINLELTNLQNCKITSFPLLCMMNT